MGFNIADLFERAVDAVPDRMALVVRRPPPDLRRDRRARPTGSANHLLAEGFGHGDHIGIYGQNSVEWMVAMVAASRSGPCRSTSTSATSRTSWPTCSTTPTWSPWSTTGSTPPASPPSASGRRGLRHFVVIDDDSDADPAGIGRSIPFADALAGASPDRPQLDRSADDHYVIYTGGTTGMPKGVVWRHEDVFYALGGGIDAYTNERVTHGHQLAEKAAATEAPMVSLNIPPLMHGAAQWGALRFLFEGNTVVFVPRFSAEAVWEPWSSREGQHHDRSPATPWPAR